ncbi:MAG: IS66 family transposase, partial [Blautia sp.]|nr:IS66 family transposase [Blautia sp.]
MKILTTDSNAKTTIVMSGHFTPICLKLKHNTNDINRSLGSQHFGKLRKGGSIASESLVAYILCEKYVKGVPYYRIEDEFPRMGLHLKRQTMTEWAIEVSDSLKYLPRYMMQLLKKLFKVIHVDETYDTVTSLSQTVYYWMFRSSEKDTSNPPIALFCFDKSRSSLVPLYYLYDYEGRVISDGYVCYKTLQDRNGNIIRCVCWVHGRRYVVKMFKGSDEEFRAKLLDSSFLMNMEKLDLEKLDELDDQDKIAMWGWIALLIMAELFRIEKGLKNLSPEERLQRRKEEMTDLIDQFFELIGLVKKHPASLINDYASKAISYFDNNKKALQEILEDGNVTLDNSAAERMAIDLALGRNAWKAHDSVRGAMATAIYYTLVETAKLNGADPQLYLEYVLTSIKDIEYKYRAELDASDAYEAKKEERLEAARARLKEHPRKDPGLDMTGLGEEPDLSFFECLMPWSKEFKAYAKKRRSDYAQYIADAITKHNLEHMKLRPSTLERILDRPKGDDDRRPVKQDLKDTIERLKPDFSAVEEAFAEHPGTPVRDLILPDARKPYSFLSSDNGSQDEPVSGASPAGATLHEESNGKNDEPLAGAAVAASVDGGGTMPSDPAPP